MLFFLLVSNIFFCNGCNYAKTTLTPRAYDIVQFNKNVCNNWIMYPISRIRFEVKNSTHVSVIVDFEQ